MIAALCAALSGLAYFASTGLGVIWPLAWLAPAPVLWLAFGEARDRTVAIAAFSAFAIGNTNLLPAYYDVLPMVPFAIGIVASGLAFAGCVLAARLVQRRVSGIAATIAFAALWTGFEYLGAFGPNGSVASIAYALAGVPVMAQTASLFGIWSVTFILCFVPAGLALAQRTRTATPLLLALLAFAGNAFYGYRHIQDSPKTMRVALIVSEEMSDAAFAGNEKDAIEAVDAYASLIGSVAERRPELVVLPERFTVLKPQWRALALKKMSGAAKVAGAPVVAGFADVSPAGMRNVALVFHPDGSAPEIYAKRKLVPGLEDRFTPGSGPLAVRGGIGIEICKDMDFEKMLRADSSLRPRVLAVPAWDFEEDAYGHARVAIMRGIENGVAVARSARRGLLTLTDPYGRLVNRRASMGDATMTLVGDLPVGEGAGHTLYDRIGDVFAWAALAIGAALLGLAALKRKRAP
ncbi:MAG TPA: nitrilase-related carbon-nitrogen hydrolase [Rhizomicrobium sp.]|nr:nitrilase-related carbon-nitrogen hydrolase [Rhizomicrobium sp.]